MSVQSMIEMSYLLKEERKDPFVECEGDGRLNRLCRSFLSHLVQHIRNENGLDNSSANKRHSFLFRCLFFFVHLFNIELFVFD